MQNFPNKITLVAAGIHAITENKKDSKEQKLLWGSLTDAQRLVYAKASEFLAQYTHGADYASVDRAKLAAQFEKAAPEIKANANDVVEIYLNIASLMV